MFCFWNSPPAKRTTAGKCTLRDQWLYYPCLIACLDFLYVHRLSIETSIFYSVAAPWFLFSLGFIFFITVAKAARWNAQTTGGLILSGSLANTSFVGLPMIEAFYGLTFVGIGILIDQLGTYLVLSTLGILVAVTCSTTGNGISAIAILRKVITFAPFQALLLALALRPIEFPPGLENVLSWLGATLAPLALVSVGYQLRLADLKGRIPALTLGLTFKLLLGPLLIALLLVKFVGAHGPVTQVTVFEVAMAPQIGAAIVAIEHKLDPPLVTLMIGIGIPLSFLTVPLWWYVLQGL